MSYILLILTTLFWSGNFVLGRAMHAEIPPFSLSFWRWVIALGILCLFAAKHLYRQRVLAQNHCRFIIIQGMLGVTAFNSLIYLAIQTTTAINAVLINSCIPVLIVVCSWVMYREVMTVRQYIGVIVSLFGVVLIIAHGEIDYLLKLRFNPGDLFVFAAAVTWALYSSNLRNYPKELHPFAYLTGIVVSGLIILTPFYLFELSTAGGFRVGTASISTILYLALFASVLAFIFWNRAVRTIGANRAGPFIHLMPVFSTILAVIFLGETIQSYHLQGISLIFMGIAMTTIKRNRS
jgi:drug/metabolite transporter (DMT)-like permease